MTQRRTCHASLDTAFSVTMHVENAVEYDSFGALSLRSITIIPVHFHTDIMADKYFSTLRSSDFSNQNYAIAFRRGNSRFRRNKFPTNDFFFLFLNVRYFVTKGKRDCDEQKTTLTRMKKPEFPFAYLFNFGGYPQTFVTFGSRKSPFGVLRNDISKIVWFPKISPVQSFDVSMQANGVSMSVAVLAAPLVKCITPLPVNAACGIPPSCSVSPTRRQICDARCKTRRTACVNVHCHCPTISSSANRRLPWICNEVG